METNYNTPAFPINNDTIVTSMGMTLLDYFAIRMPEPSKEDVQFEANRDRAKNPHNYPDKPPLRTETEIICCLKYKRASAMLEERKKYIK